MWCTVPSLRLHVISDARSTGSGSKGHSPRSSERSRAPLLLRHTDQLRRGTDAPPSTGLIEGTQPDKNNSKTAAQRPKRRCREIPDRWVPSGREVLEIFQDGGVHPEAADDLHAASAHAVPCRSDGGRPSVGDECSSRPGSPVRTISCAGNSDKIASKMTQHQVRTRNDVLTRLARIDVYRR